MPLIYNTTLQTFLKKEIQKHSGNSPFGNSTTISSAESFYINKFIDVSQYGASYFTFDTPLYYTMGGTPNYYNQDIYSIFTNISRPFIRFVFTANTISFGTGTTIKHNIYRIPYDEFSKYASEIIRKSIEEIEDSSTEEIKETFTDESGSIKTTSTSRTTSKTNTTQKSAPKLFPSKISSTDNNDKLAPIRSLLENPILTITATTTGITTDVYNLFLDEYQKKKGDYKFQLFQDYAQYFITTQFNFQREQGADYTEFYQIDSNKNLILIDYQKDFTETTLNRAHTITAGTFSGVSVVGNFFTYFLIPNKPKWESPLVSGQLTTFSPTWRWSETDDGDNFVLQVVYNTGDTTFSGTVYSYPISKEDTRLSTNEMLGTDVEPWSITQKTTDVIRKMSVSLSPGKTFLYRIGNVKELINLFGVKQRVVTFSDINSATTSYNAFNTYISVESDSPYVDALPKLEYPDYLDYGITTLDSFILSGTVSGSTVTGATIQLIYPNTSYVTQSTDSLGNYLFDSLEAGTYALNTYYRGYQQDSRVISITGDTSLSFRLKLLWSNNVDTWDKMANENYFV